MIVRTHSHLVAVLSFDSFGWGSRRRVNVGEVFATRAVPSGLRGSFRELRSDDEVLLARVDVERRVDGQLVRVSAGSLVTAEHALAPGQGRISSRYAAAHARMFERVEVD